MKRFSDITALDWDILHALSNDYESIEQIQSFVNYCSNRSATPNDILDRLEYLHQSNYVFLALNQLFDRQKLIDEINEKTHNSSYWFGRTENGYLAWHELTDKYGKKTEQGVAGDPPQGVGSPER